jgi:hypothetical protein
VRGTIPVIFAARNGLDQAAEDMAFTTLALKLLALFLTLLSDSLF